MEKALNSYESLFIVSLEGGEEVTGAAVDKFVALIEDNAQVIDIAKWGKRRLAYPINDMNDGYYVVATFKSEPAFPAELERLFNINEAIMRSLTIRLEYDAAEKARKSAIPAPVVLTSDDADASDAAPAAETVTAESAQTADNEVTDAAAE